MSEIVYSHTENLVNRTSGPFNKYTSIVATDIKTTVFSSPTKVAVVVSELHACRASYNSDKRYWRWQTVSSSGFRINRAGHVQPYSCTRKPGVLAWSPHFPAFLFKMFDDETDNGHVAMAKEVKYRFGISSVADIYPMVNVLDMLDIYEHIPATIRPAMRSDNIGDFAEQVFGKTRLTPAFKKNLLKTDPMLIALASDFRGYIKDSELENFVKVCSDADREELHSATDRFFTPRMRPVIRTLPTVVAQSLATKAPTGSAYRQIQLLSEHTIPLNIHRFRSAPKHGINKKGELMHLILKGRYNKTIPNIHDVKSWDDIGY